MNLNQFMDLGHKLLFLVVIVLVITVWSDRGRLEFFTRLDEVVVSTANGKKLVVKLHDGVIGNLLVRGKEWEPNVTTVLARIVKPGDIVLDLGSNYGYHTIDLAKIVGDTGKIYAFEANPLTYTLLQNNLDLNRIKNVVTFNYAAYSANSTVSFKSLYKTDDDNLGHSHIVTSAGAGTISIPAVRLDDVLNDVSQINVIKMDIEGAELPAVYGAKRLITNSPNLTIVAEWYPEMLSKHGDIQEFINFFRKQGYKFAVLENTSLREIDDAYLLQAKLVEVVISKNLATVIQSINQKSAEEAVS